MDYILCIIGSEYFTAGKIYPVLDWGPGYVLTQDDNFQDRIISGTYFEEHFEENT